MRSWKSACAAALLIAGACAVAAPARETFASTLVVQDSLDSSPHGLSGTLALAMPGDVVTFSPAITTIRLGPSPVAVGASITIQGPGSGLLTILAEATPRHFVVAAGSSVAIVGLTLASGGGIDNSGDLLLRDVSFRNCFSEQGGALQNQGSLSLAECRIVDCAAREGGGIYSSGTVDMRQSEILECIGQRGGALCLAHGSRLDATGVTLALNGNALGFAIYGDSADVRLVNCTISDNSGENVAVLLTGGSLVMINSTVVYNYTSGQISGSAGVGLLDVAASVHNSYVAGNYAAHWGSYDGLGDCCVDSNFNLTGDSGYGPPPVLKLQPLGYYGGFGRTRPPLADSPVIDQGASSGYAFDERLYLRPYDDPGVPNIPGGDGSDIGAVEFGASSGPVSVTPSAEGGTARLTGIVPNPAQAWARVGFSLARPGSARIDVYAVDGRRVRGLLDAWRPAGAGAITWDGRDDRGIAQPAGVYFVRLWFNGEVSRRRIILSP